MAKFTQKYTIVHTIAPLADSYEYSAADWPPHVTLADIFAIDGNPMDLLRDLGEGLAHKPVLKARVVGDKWFGENTDVHVKLLARSTETQKLHESILDILARYNVRYNSPEYTGAGFILHSAVQKSSELHDSDTVVFDSLTLIDMFPNEDAYRRQVLGTVRIGR